MLPFNDMWTAVV